MTDNFNNYMIDMLLEQIAAKELKLYFSPRFKKFLKSIEHPIAEDLLASDSNDGVMVKKTYIDLDDTDMDKITFISVPKAMSIISSVYDGEEIPSDTFYNYSLKPDASVYNQNRVSMKINKFVNQLFPNKYKPSGDPATDMESFVNIFKSKRDTGKFEIVKGEDIVRYYNEDNYAESEGGGSLSSSCMREGKCASYIDFYAQNEDKVSMLILRDDKDDTKIRGRAILWDLDSPDRIFMDRIYTFYDADIELFKAYAKTNGWLHKIKQNMEESEEIIDTTTGEANYMDLSINGLTDSGEFPYMDTMKFYSDGDLSNDEEAYIEFYKLEDINGGYDNSDDGRIYVEYYDDRFDEDEIFWCDRGDGYRTEYDCYYSEFYGEMIADDYAEDNMTDCDYYDGSEKYRDSGDYTHIERYNINVADDYLENNDDEFTYSEYDDEYIKSDDAVWSDHHGTHIYDGDATEVFTDADKSDTDWRVTDDGAYFEYEDEYYDDDVEEDDIKRQDHSWSDFHDRFISDDDAVEVYTDVDKDDTDWREEDDDSYFTHEGEYYTNDLEDELTGVDEDEDEDETEKYSTYHGEDIDEDDAVKVFTDIDDKETDWREEDDDSYFEFNNKYYDNGVDVDELKERTGEKHSEVDEYEDGNSEADVEYVKDASKDANYPKYDDNDIPEDWEEALEQNESVMSLTKFNEFMAAHDTKKTDKDD